jgi:AspBHI-like restriction endonuclease/restriction endonuclease
MSDPVPFNQLATADLFVDRVYKGGANGNVGDDPLHRLLPVGNQGGFRYRGSVLRGDIQLVVLYTSGEDPDWPDYLDPFTGTLTYFGDNKRPGNELHETQRRGNQILRMMFELAHGDAASRSHVPPVFVFSRAEAGRDVIFRGLAVPGTPAASSGDDLVAVWRAVGGRRFQNYRATFTVLDQAVVSRAWIDHLILGQVVTAEWPAAWRAWVEKGTYRPLISERLDIRSRVQQLPPTKAGRAIINIIHKHFQASPVLFEQCAVDLWRMLAPATGEVELTRPWRDGGRDAIGTYLLGPAADRLRVEFALEAKCYLPSNAVGVREMSRLISRLRFRQFGVFVTTSYFNDQVYQEVRKDQHPVALVCGRDLVELLRSNGLTTAAVVERWLERRYPPSAS